LPPPTVRTSTAHTTKRKTNNRPRRAQLRLLRDSGSHSQIVRSAALSISTDPSWLYRHVSVRTTHELSQAVGRTTHRLLRQQLRAMPCLLKYEYFGTTWNRRLRRTYLILQRYSAPEQSPVGQHGPPRLSNSTRLQVAKDPLATGYIPVDRLQLQTPRRLTRLVPTRFSGREAPGQSSWA